METTLERFCSIDKKGNKKGAPNGAPFAVQWD
jgi:hypothetical protein